LTVPAATDTAFAKVEEAVWQFLEQALGDPKPEPEDLVARSSEVLHGVVDVLPTTDEGEWNQGRRAVVLKAAHALSGRPEKWQAAVQIGSDYLARDWRPEHPRLDVSMSRNHPGRPPLHPVHVDLQDSLLEALFEVSTPEARKHFLSEVSTWNVLRAVSERVAKGDLTEDEVTAFLVASGRFNPEDGGFSEVEASLLEWARRLPERAVAVVDAWLLDHRPAAEISPTVVSLLVEGAVVGLGNTAWRDRVLEHLDHRGTEAALRLAAHLSYSAWPSTEASNVERRQKLLLERALRLPEVLVPTALAALRRDTGTHPEETFEAAVRLFNGLPLSSMSSEKSLAALLELLHVGVRSLSAAKAAEKNLQPYLEMLAILPGLPLGHHRLDALLRDLVNVDGEAVFSALTDFVVRRSSAIVESAKSFGEIFPRLSGDHPAVTDRWILRWMISKSPEARLLGSTLFGRRRDGLPAAVATLAPDEVYALALALGSAQRMVGGAWVPALVELGRVRPELLSLIEEILVDHAAEQYPGTLRRALVAWEADDAAAPYAIRVQKHLEHKEGLWTPRENVAELRYFPALRHWNERQDRAASEAAERAQQQSPLLALISKVPIARGEATSWSGNPDEQMKFARYETTAEFPALDMVDPFEAEKLRRKWVRAAEEAIGKLLELPKDA
jgi:hypothetical protein